MILFVKLKCIILIYGLYNLFDYLDYYYFFNFCCSLNITKVAIKNIVNNVYTFIFVYDLFFLCTFCFI